MKKMKDTDNIMCNIDILSRLFPFLYLQFLDPVILYQKYAEI